MKQCRLHFEAWVLPLTLIMAGCASMEEPKAKNASLGLITTPASYYSTYKARSLGEKYKVNLDRLVERIVRNPKTANLQFANNIASVGGIGFFTHSAATISDERYLEVVLSAPETFETNGEYSSKLNRLFTLYGIELLSILVNDSEIYQEKEVSGYGLNLSWRKVTREPTGPRVALERAVAYLPKQRVRGFLRQELNQNDLLRDAVIFAMEEDGPMKLVTYRPEEPKPDFRPPIQEETLAATQLEPKSEVKPSTSPAPQIVEVLKVEKKAEGTRSEQLALNAKLSPSPVQPTPIEKKEEIGTTSSAQEKIASSKVAADKTTSETPTANPVAQKRSAQPPLASDKVNEIPTPSAQAPAPKTEAIPVILPPVAETGQAVPAAVPNLETSSERKASEAVKGRTELPKKKANQVRAKPELAMKNTEATEAAPTAAINPSSALPASVTSGGEAKQDKVRDSKAQEQVTDSTKTSEPPVEVQSAEVRTPGSVIVTSKAEIKVPAVSPPAATKVTPPKEENKLGETKSKNPVAATAEAMRAFDQPKPVEERPPESIIVASKPEVKGAPVTQQPPAKLTPSNEENVGKTEGLSGSVFKAEAGKLADRSTTVPIEDKKPEPAAVAPKSEMKSAVVGQPMPPKVIPKAEESASKTKPPIAAAAKAESVKTPDQPKSVQERKPEPTIAKVQVKEPETKAQEDVAEKQEVVELPVRLQPGGERKPESISTPAKTEVKAPEAKPAPAQAVPAKQAKGPEKPASEQIALLRKPIESIPEKRPLPRPPPKALEGYIIQLSFAEQSEAQRWAENLTSQGYAVSMTEAGSGSAFRVRIGNFAGRTEAERQLKTLGRGGLKGIVLNLPQAYRPEVSRPAAEATGQTISVTE